MTEYVIVYWKDIPSAVEAGHGDSVVRAPLSARFQDLIDAVSMKQGLTSTDEYLAHWEKRSGGTRPGEPREVVDKVVAELESQFDEILTRHIQRMTEYVVVYWKDIPSAVEAGHGDSVVRAPLSARFQDLIDAVSMKQGLTSTDEYLAYWEKRSGGTRPGEPREVVDKVVAELENQFDEILTRHIKS